MVSGVLFGFIMPILICIIPQMWRRMTNRAYYKYHATGPSIEESNPFIPHTSGNGQVRSNIAAAARQFNESPNFQRLTNQTSSATLGRIRNNGNSTLSRSNNNTNNNGNNHHLQNVYAAANMHRVEDYLANNDPYSMYNHVPSAPAPPPPITNYSQGVYGQSNYASANVPIVLYPNQGARTLSRHNRNVDTMRRQPINNYQMN